MNFQEITKLIIDNGGVDALVGEDIKSGILPDYEIIHEEGDCEGGGDYSEKVYHFKEDNIYLRVTGFYASYSGTDWNGDLTEVFPKEKTITVYE